MKNILLYLSAFIPMYALIIVKQIIEIAVGNLKATFLNFFIIALLVCVVFGLIGLKTELTNNKAKTKKIVIINKTNTTDQNFLGYFSLFVLFAITFDLSRISMFVVFVSILTMIGVVYVKNKLFYINPFLNILGFNFYDITYKVCGSDTKQITKIFFKGDLLLNKEYYVKIKDENFSFLNYAKKTKQIK